MAKVVIDASALLALLNNEPGADTVAVAIPQAVISTVNLSEVVAKLAEAGMPQSAIQDALQGLQIEVVPFDLEQAYAAGLLQPATKARGLSLGDRACLSLAKELKLVALTADRRWEHLPVGVKVKVIR